MLHFSLFHYSSCCFTFSMCCYATFFSHVITSFSSLSASMKISQFWWSQYFVWLLPHTILAHSELLVSVTKSRSITAQTPGELLFVWKHLYIGSGKSLWQHGHLPKDPSSSAAINRDSFTISPVTILFDAGYLTHSFIFPDSFINNKLVSYVRIFVFLNE